MRTRSMLALALALTVAAPAVAWARTAVIELAAPVQDQSHDAIRTALHDAVEQATRGAAAMGLPYVDLRDAEMVGDAVAIQLLASDSPLDSDRADNGSSADPDINTTAYAPIQ
jgi:hypothetical protein